jgi:sugar lactone lactonase YvrE
MVCEVSPVQGKVIRRLPAGHGARSPVISHDGKTLFVCNWWGEDVSVVDVASGGAIATMKSLREPYAAAMTPDDSVLVVTNFNPTQRSTDTMTAASKVLLFDAHTKRLRDTLALPVGSEGVAGVTVSPDGRYAFATHSIGTFYVPTTKVDNGWIHTNNCAVVDIKNRRILNVASLDFPISGAANPWGVACSPDGKMLCVTHAGANFLSVVDLAQFVTMADTNVYSLDGIKLGSTSVSLFHNLTAASHITHRVKINGKSPRALTVVGSKAITAGFFDDFLDVFDIGLDTIFASGTVALGPEVPKAVERKGEVSFYDAGMCLQHWQSCHTCHPFARADGLNWTLNSEICAPKNATSMIYSWWTPPTTWTGRRANASESIRAGIKSELFLQPDPVIAETMDTFFMSLKPVPSPHLFKGRFSVSALRGREVFYGGKAACVVCHPGPLFTDMKRHNAGIPDQYDGNTQWDTPTLIECWRTAPYGHLGSKLTIREMVEMPGMGGVGGKLSEGEISDLVEFVLSL